MAGDVFDLMVRHHNRKFEMSLDRAHPADLNAFTYGLISGLNLGVYLMQASKEYDKGMEDILADLAKPLHDVLASANGLMPAGWVFRWEMYCQPGYRRSESAQFYQEGIRLGFSYVFLLFDAYNSGVYSLTGIRRLTAEYVEVVKNLILPT